LTYLLDTNIVSYWMRGDRRLIAKIRSCKPYDLSISTVTLAEIYYGIGKSPVKKAVRRRKIDLICAQLKIHPFDEAAAEMYSIARAQLENGGTIISERDLQIASIALSRKLTVVTHNVKEFARIKNLLIEDWAEDD